MNDPSLLQGHGGQIDAMAAAFPNAPLPWVDLSTGINPFSYPLPPISREAWATLPTARDRERCEVAMAAAFGCDRAHCRAVPGTELVIRQLPTILSGRRVVVRSRSYADHAVSWSAAGAEVNAVDDPLDHLDHADVVVLVNPNNPDGMRWPIERIEGARAELASRGGWLIVDEAYADLEPALSVSSMAGREGLVVLRSFGKFFGLAGVRLGAALGPPVMLSEITDRLGSWDVSGPALSLGAHAYSNLQWHDAARARLRTACKDLSCLIAKVGIEELGGTDLFRFVRVPDADKVWKVLANRGIAVRRFREDSRHLRIGLPDFDALIRLADVLSL
ncbi:threonine-phosphate decarboxylase CobD [Croceicoccus sp. F390]|uniref:threonine-phosphate decarboxylase n=1 Tax=Croceicoccus esteveae TaxID=3075597 RepID=A0ABU2ZKG7_9SPHN|nr:threonine-phosphate decarboxylase CobD [Croceicoccus sp. F390]MDT0577104.1 threonine-phosphate decarboxylase CobD [Croceicoccus sp. F390]